MIVTWSTHGAQNCLRRTRLISISNACFFFLSKGGKQRHPVSSCVAYTCMCSLSLLFNARLSIVLIVCCDMSAVCVCVCLCFFPSSGDLKRTLSVSVPLDILHHACMNHRSGLRICGWETGALSKGLNGWHSSDNEKTQCTIDI